MSRISASLIVLTVMALGLLCTDAAAVSCCRKYTKAVVPMMFIKGYSIQTIERSCHINSVIFHTFGGKNICADPTKAWVMDSIRKLREKVQAFSKKNSKV